MKSSRKVPNGPSGRRRSFSEKERSAEKNKKHKRTSGHGKPDRSRKPESKLEFEQGVQLGENADQYLGSKWLWSTGVTMLVLLMWAYWPTLGEMVHKWETQPDYSHGYLVIPIAALFLWSRRSSFPWNTLRPSWWGAVLLVVAVALRVVAGMYYLLPLDGWTLPLTLGGTVWLLFGTAVLRWCWPAIVFLWFMVPIPYTAESFLRVPLQAIATKLSTAILIILGQPAIAEGNVILVGEHALFVEEACSGLRIFVGIFALSFAFMLFSRWSWWQKMLVLLTTFPVAIIANVTRIVVTGILFQNVSSATGQQFSHDFSGYVVIPLAAFMFWMFLIYLDKLFPQVEEIRLPSQLYRDRASSMVRT